MRVMFPGSRQLGRSRSSRCPAAYNLRCGSTQDLQSSRSEPSRVLCRVNRRGSGECRPYGFSSRGILRRFCRCLTSSTAKAFFCTERSGQGRQGFRRPGPQLGRGKIEAGGPFLNVVFRYSKWIAVLAAMFLLSANLDNVPDSPELLTSGSGVAVSAQLAAHLALPALPGHPCATCMAARPLLARTHWCLGSLAAVLPSFVPRLLHQAADPSPPMA